MTDVNWRVIVFWAALFWFVYSAPTEGLLTRAFMSPPNTHGAEWAEDL